MIQGMDINRDGGGKGRELIILRLLSKQKICITVNADADDQVLALQPCKKSL